MRRPFHYLIAALLTFSIGCFLHVASEYYNRVVRVEQAAKLNRAESVAPVPQRELSRDEILWRIRKARCFIRLQGECTIYSPVGEAALTDECREYLGMLHALE
jgi:hypothetical protein